MKKKILLVFFIIVIMGFLGYNFVYQDHRDIASSDATSSFTTSELTALLTDDDASNDVRALDQVIEVSGIATDVKTTSITLNGQVFIELSNAHDTEINQPYTIKGRCLGYDDLLQEVKVDQAIFINSPN
ncbi:MAG: hypothetical protein ACJAT0_000636 [Nonlabens sp.]|jgi:hypothetical protein|uniref:OB-fold protein n=1 Tax=Nonlabens sp. TaxID=1888209 RepID=UPI0039E2F41A